MRLFAKYQKWSEKWTPTCQGCPDVRHAQRQRVHTKGVTSWGSFLWSKQDFVPLRLDSQTPKKKRICLQHFSNLVFDRCVSPATYTPKSCYVCNSSLERKQKPKTEQISTPIYWSHEICSRRCKDTTILESCSVLPEVIRRDWHVDLECNSRTGYPFKR